MDQNNYDDSDVGLIANTLNETTDLAFSEDAPGVYDEAEEGGSDVEQITYDITSYGADFPTDMLLARLKSRDIVIPTFQREFVWTLRDASRFIESLILGLPVPGIFLSKDKQNRLVVVDGQQRLRSLFAYFENDFKGRSFALTKVHSMLEGRRYKELEPEQRRMLENALIHATIFMQNSPDGESATYSIFERLNTGGRRLFPQEIRAAIHHEGGFSAALKKFNEIQTWRDTYGNKKSERMKDVELILRFLALFNTSDAYEKPMKTFLNKYMANNASIDASAESVMRSQFENTIIFVSSVLGSRAFKPKTAFNAAVFDSVMVGIARRLGRDPYPASDGFRAAYDALLQKSEFISAYSKATSDKESVSNRLRIATEAFENL